VTRHFCPPTTPQGLLEPDAVKAARPVLKGAGAQQCAPAYLADGTLDPLHKTLSQQAIFMEESAIASSRRDMHGNVDWKRRVVGRN